MDIATHTPGSSCTAVLRTRDLERAAAFYSAGWTSEVSLGGYHLPARSAAASILSHGNAHRPDCALRETPWYWALNGIFGVLSSAVAVFLSIYFGIWTNFVIAAVCYAVLAPCLYQLNSQARQAAAQRA